MAPATASPTYDEDGNLTSDSRWTYTSDGENCLIAMESTTNVLSAGVPKRRLEFLYDGQSRRISKKVMNWKQGDWREPRWISRQRNPKGETSVRRERVNATTSAWVTNDERRFAYDGWNSVAEVDNSGNLIQTHTWGMDLSGTAQSAGGVGGLLWSNDVANTQVLFAAYDGNGNVVAMISTSDSKVKARYDYNAFGETVLQEGDGTLVSNPYRFSTKYQDEETGLYYYGFRYYDPQTGRWINKDPIGERGGLNLYGMVGNDPVNGIDVLGLDRYLDMTELHPAIYVDKYDENGKKTGCYDRLHFGPSISLKNGAHVAVYLVLKKVLRGAPGGAWGAAASVAVFDGEVFIDENVDLPGPFSNRRSRIISSSKRDDEMLVEFVNGLNEEKISYNALFFNCQHFVTALAEYPMKDFLGFSLNPIPFTTKSIQEMIVPQRANANIWEFERNEGDWGIYRGPNGELKKIYNGGDIDYGLEYPSTMY